MYTITTTVDTAEAETFDAARLAGATLIDDARGNGHDVDRAEIHNGDGKHEATVKPSEIGDGYTTHYGGTRTRADVTGRAR